MELSDVSEKALNSLRGLITHIENEEDEDVLEVFTVIITGFGRIGMSSRHTADSAFLASMINLLEDCLRHNNEQPGSVKTIKRSE